VPDPSGDPAPVRSAPDRPHRPDRDPALPDLSGTVALVTGGGGGIGGGVAARFAAAGAAVVVHHRGAPDAADDVVRRIVEQGGRAVTAQADVTDPDAARGHAHYAASKAAVIMLARAAALEYGRRGIRVNSVSPGLIDRPGLAGAWSDGVARWQAGAPLGRLGSPIDVGDACVFLASPMARWITGHDLVVDGGMAAVPGW